MFPPSFDIQKYEQKLKKVFSYIKGERDRKNPNIYIYLSRLNGSQEGEKKGQILEISHQVRVLVLLHPSYLWIQVQ